MVSWLLVDRFNKGQVINFPRSGSVEDAKSSKDKDERKWSPGTSYAELRFQRLDGYLMLYQLSSSNQLMIQDWYSADASKKAQVEVFRAKFGSATYAATQARVESLVTALSAFSRPSTTIGNSTSLNALQKATVNQAIANAWLSA